MYRESIAREYLELTDMWDKTDKKIIIDNLTKLLCEKYPKCQKINYKKDILARVTNSNIHTVYAWLNSSRANVKIPLLKLCMVATHLDVGIYKFFEIKHNGL